MIPLPRLALPHASSSISPALSAFQLALDSAERSGYGRCPDNTPRGYRYGRSPKKNIAVAAWHAPFGRCPEEADLCRGQGFRRIASPAPPRSEDRHVQGPPGPQGQERIADPDAGQADARRQVRLPAGAFAGPPRAVCRNSANRVRRYDALPIGESLLRDFGRSCRLSGNARFSARNEGSPMAMVGFPLLLIPLAIYNIIVFLMPDVSFGRPAREAEADVGHRMAGHAERYPAGARRR